ncbi:MAG TPA: LytTR family DNA-binding domain-containing protein [Pseudomonas sp.]
MTTNTPRTHFTITRRIDGENIDQLVPVASVFRFVADCKYVTAYHDGGEFLLDATLKAIAEEFGDQLMKPHRSHLVRRDRIAAFETVARHGGIDQHYLLHLQGASAPVPVSRRYRRAFEQVLAEAKA